MNSGFSRHRSMNNDAKKIGGRRHAADRARGSLLTITLEFGRGGLRS